MGKRVGPEGRPLTPAPNMCFFVPLTVAVVSFVTLISLGLAGWPTETGLSAFGFCESLLDGIVKQRANTWSNLSFTAVGLLIGLRAWLDLESGALSSRVNRMVTTTVYPTTYGTVVVLVGSGSIAMHASTTSWGGKADVFCMYLWVAFLVVYALARSLDFPAPRFFTYYLLTAFFTLALLLLFNDYVTLGNIEFVAPVAVYAVIEGWILTRPPECPYDLRWLLAAAVGFVIAATIWLLSRQNGPLCNPTSLIQGHAIWHILSALSMGALYLFYRSERPAKRWN